MTSKQMNDSRVSLVGGIGASSMKTIQQKDKIILQKDKKIAAQEEKIGKLQLRLKKKEDKTDTIAKKKADDAKRKEKNLTKWTGDINATAILIAQMARQIYKKFPYGGKEHHFQALLEAELQRKGIVAQQEVTVLYKVVTSTGEVLQLPHDIRGREDILLPQEKMILELKQTRNLGDSEHHQLLRYMYQRQNFSEWGNQTKGMLINFGDEDLEIWFVHYENDEPKHIRLLKLPRVFHRSWEVDAFKMIE